MVRLLKSGFQLLVLSSVLVLTTGCVVRGRADAPTPAPLIFRTPVDFSLPSSGPTMKPMTPTEVPAIATIAPNPTSTPTSTAIPSYTPTATLVPTWEWYPPGNITAPILLYHHVADDGNGTRYFITQDVFRTQMRALYDWGYTSITTSTLAKVIKDGGELPDRPVIITFDDGYADVYMNAYPIMQEYGFIGTIFLYVDRIGYSKFMGMDEIQALLAAGWEVGSHSMSHSDLTKDHSIVVYEVQESRTTLEEMTGEQVFSFSYPYGELDEYVISTVRDSGYIAGMGLGLNYNHSLDTLFNLQRIEIYADYSFDKFTELLPWSDK